MLEGAQEAFVSTRLRRHAKMKRRAKLAIAFLAIVVAAVAMRGAQRTYRIDRWHLRCVNCLQDARLREDRILGIRFSIKLALSGPPSGIMDAGSFSPELPGTDTPAYERIHGHPCRHAFKKGGWSQSNSWTGREADGSAGRQRPYALRMKAIASLFTLHASLGDKVLAKRTYALVDTLWPLGLVEEDKELGLWEFGERLYSLSRVKTEADASAFLDDFEGPHHPPRGLDLFFLHASLQLVETRQDWREVLDALESTSNLQKRLAWIRGFVDRKAQSADPGKDEAAATVRRQLDVLWGKLSGNAGRVESANPEPSASGEAR